MDIFADLPTALFGKTSKTQTADIYSIIRKLHQWKSVRLQGPIEHHVNAVNTYALYLAVSTLTLHAGFSFVLENGHGKQCVSANAATLEDVMAVQESKDKLLDHSDILQWYHALLIDACSIARLYASCKEKTSPPTEILVSLRQVWKLTWHIHCPLANDFGAVMTQIMGDPTAGLPLFLYTQ